MWEVGGSRKGAAAEREAENPVCACRDNASHNLCQSTSSQFGASKSSTTPVVIDGYEKINYILIVDSNKWELNYIG